MNRRFCARMSALLLTGLLLAGRGLAAPAIGGCPLFPADNYWNTPVINAPVHPQSASYIAAIGANTGLHPDFGTVWNGAPNGIPFTVVPAEQATTNMSAGDFLYWDESDLGAYPIPANPPIEGGADGDGDRHILIVRQGECRLYELFDAHPKPGGGWTAGSGAIFDLNSNTLRPDTWTSADAAGFAILPGLIRLEEVLTGNIEHAIRFTASQVYMGYTWPARHSDGRASSSANPPMGQRFRLKAGYDISGYTPRIQVILRAFKRYGLVLADTGSDWYISGAPNPNWDDDELRQLRQLTGNDFEAVDMSMSRIDADSGQSKSWLDFNFSGQVDSRDLGILMSTWGVCAACNTDLDRDGKVDAGDFASFAEEGFQIPARNP